MIAFDQVIKLLQEYKEQHGDCLVPFSYITEDGIRLGSIVNTIRSGGRKTNADEKAMLDSLGFVWKVNANRLSFEEVVRHLEEYKEKYGDCLVPQSYTTEDGIHLGNIVSCIRMETRKVSAEEKVILDGLGFVWKMKARRLSFKDVIMLLQEYKEKYGDCLVPWSYTTEDGVRLGKVVVNIRSGNRKVSEDEKEMLDNLGFVWKIKTNESILSFNQVLRLLQEYKEQYGDCSVPRSYTTEDGIHLGSIVNNIRSGVRKTSEEEKAMLDSLGFIWYTKRRN